MVAFLHLLSQGDCYSQKNRQKPSINAAEAKDGMNLGTFLAAQGPSIAFVVRWDVKRRLGCIMGPRKSIWFVKIGT